MDFLQAIKSGKTMGIDFQPYTFSFINKSIIIIIINKTNKQKMHCNF